MLEIVEHASLSTAYLLALQRGYRVAQTAEAIFYVITTLSFQRIVVSPTVGLVWEGQGKANKYHKSIISPYTHHRTPIASIGAHVAELTLLLILNKTKQQQQQSVYVINNHENGLN